MVDLARAIFQRFMDTLLQDLASVSVYFNDILITGSTLEEHLQHLQNVLVKLQAAGLHLNCDKCSFVQPSNMD